MKYDRVAEGIFLERPNRFIAHVEIDGKFEVAHVKNTGRCKELLIPGTKVFLNQSTNPSRKTKYDLFALYKGDILINMDSQAPNKVVHEWLEGSNLFGDVEYIKPEATYGKSRFDFFVKSKTRDAYIEVKGVTLEENGTALFPDAPTQRGIKHIYELCSCLQEGFDAHIIFVIQMGNVDIFKPNDITHSDFGDALRFAARCGVHIHAYDCRVGRDFLHLRNPVKVVL